MRTQLVICAIFLWLDAPLAAAQEIGSNPRDTVGSSVTLDEARRSPGLDLSRWTNPSASPEIAVARRWQTPQLVARQGGQTTASSNKRSPMRIILGAAVGATAGLFAGGYIGAWIEGDRCNCDDPGLMGALIGAPIGAAAGGILGGFFLF